VTRLSTEHLRLVSIDDDLPESAATPSAAPLPFVTEWKSLCECFSTSTGLNMTFRAADDPPLAASPIWTRAVPAVGHMAPGHLSIVDKKARTSAARVAAGQELAEHIGGLVAELHEAHRTLWQREAELATAIPLVVRPEEEQSYLAARFEAILQCGAEAIDCHAAAMYILDDDTRHLKLRSHWGLDHGRFVDPPRALRTARADVEALAGHAITLSDTSECRKWDVPEDHAAAICVPISTMTVPLGTLWVFSETKREFDDREVNLIETIAGRLSVELEREILLREQGISGNASYVTEAISWQQDSLPSTAPDVGDWQVAARPSSRSRLHGDYYRWQVAKNGDLNLTLTTAHDNGVPAALTSATIGGLLEQQPEFTMADPVEVLTRIHSTLFATSAGDRHASGFSGSISEENGSLRYASAGNIDAFVVRPHGWEAITPLAGRPLGDWDEPICGGSPTSLAGDLGDVADGLNQGELRVEPGDVLLVLSGKPHRRPRLVTDTEQDGAFFAEAILHHSHLSAGELTGLLASLWEHDRSVWSLPPAILIAKHRG